MKIILKFVGIAFLLRISTKPFLYRVKKERRKKKEEATKSKI